MSKAIDLKTEEMIALGVAYALNCQKCMKIHKISAHNAGVTQEEMKEALSVAAGVITGAKGVAEKAAEQIFGSKIEDNRCCPEDSECCP